MSTANAAHIIQCNANDNGIKSIEQNFQNLHNAIVHSKPCKSVNLQVAYCTKHDCASVAPAAACSTACIAHLLIQRIAIKQSRASKQLKTNSNTIKK